MHSFVLILPPPIPSSVAEYIESLLGIYYWEILDYLCKRGVMDDKWKTLILSDVNYQNLVAEVCYDGQFVLLLDREQGNECVLIAFPQKDGMLGLRVPLSEFIDQLKASADNLCR